MFGEVELANYRANDVIRLTRRAAGLSQEALSEGICSVEAFSRIERGKTKVKRDTYKKIMERLERNTDKFYAVCSGEDVDLLDDLAAIENAIAKFDYQLADSIFLNVKDRIGDAPENKQYVESIKAIIDHGLGKISAETEKLYLECALLLTVPDYKIFLHKCCAEVYPYTEHEMLILMNIAACNARTGNPEDEIQIYNMLLKCFKNGYISGEKCMQLKITILRNLAYALGRKEKYLAALKMTECVKQLCLKYDYGYKLCIAINDSSWIYRNLYENKLEEKYYKLGKQQYRQAYYLALARKDNILAEKLKKGYQKFFQSNIDIV